MAEEAEDKTEEPTGKRLSDARGKGDVPQSQEIKALATMVSALIMVGILAPGMAREISNVSLPFIERPHTIRLDTPQALATLMGGVAIDVGLIMAWPLAIVLVLGLVFSLVQTKGMLWVPNKLAPDLQRINLLAALKKFITFRPYLDLIKSVLKMVIVGGLLVWMVWPRLIEFEGLARLEMVTIIAYLQERIYALVLTVLIVVLIMAAADFLYENHAYHEKMKMTKQEVRDEHKQQEGDPMVKGRLASLRMQRARQRMMAAVPKADVVVTNPTHYAVALKYDMDAMNAPVLVAKGVDLIAKRIRDLAEENEVPVVENPPLARALYASVELDQEVPPEHYKAVAEVIGYVMRLKGKIAH